MAIVPQNLIADAVTVTAMYIVPTWPVPTCVHCGRAICFTQTGSIKAGARKSGRRALSLQ